MRRIIFSALLLICSDPLMAFDDNFFFFKSSITKTFWVGNQSAIGEALSTTMTASVSMSMRFSPRTTTTLGEVDIFAVTVIGIPDYAIRLHSDENGAPGTVLTGPITLSAPVTGWNPVSFTAPATVTAGVQFHVSVFPLSYAVDPGNYFVINSTLPNAHRYPYDQVEDANQGTARDSGSGWVAYPGEQPVMTLGYGAYPYVMDGNPNAGWTEEILAGTSDFRGERFRVTTLPINVTTVAVYVRRVNSPYALLWRIRRLSDNTVMKSGLWSGTQAQTLIGDSYGWLEATITNVQLSAGEYRFELYRNSAVGSYAWPRSRTLNSQAPYPGLSYDGTNAYAESSTDGTTWSAMSSDNSDDFPFRLGLSSTTHGEYP